MPISKTSAIELFELVANDERQSFEVNCWCYARAMRMSGLLLLNDVMKDDIGWVVICSPPAWLQKQSRRQVMTAAPAVDQISIKSLLNGKMETVFEKYLFKRIPTTSGGDISILDRNGNSLYRPGSSEPLPYRFADFNCVSWWDTHITSFIISDETEQSKIVIDPDIADAPIDINEWRLRQDPYGVTCLLIIDWDGNVVIDYEHSSVQTLDAIKMANNRINGKDCDDSDLIAFLTDGAILSALFENPYYSTNLNGIDVDAVEKIFELFGDWLAPLVAFKRWRAQTLAVYHNQQLTTSLLTATNSVNNKI